MELWAETAAGDCVDTIGLMSVVTWSLCQSLGGGLKILVFAPEGFSPSFEPVFGYSKLCAGGPVPLLA